MQRIYRLKNKNDFKLLFRAGHRIEMAAFRVIVRKNLLAYARFAFITPKSAEKRAVRRNLIRRRSKEWIRKYFPFHGAGLDIAFLFKKPAWALTREELYKELKNAKEEIIN